MSCGFDLEACFGQSARWLSADARAVRDVSLDTVRDRSIVSLVDGNGHRRCVGEQVETTIFATDVCSVAQKSFDAISPQARKDLPYVSQNVGVIGEVDTPGVVTGCVCQDWITGMEN